MRRTDEFAPALSAIDRIIESELVVTVGCTDPSAIGLSVAAAVSAYSQKAGSFNRIDSLEQITVEVDVNIYKNATAAGIPGVKRHGIPLAVSLGAAVGDSSRGLTIFQDLDEQTVDLARKIRELIPIRIVIRQDFAPVTIMTSIRWKRQDTSSTMIAGAHDRILWTAVNGHQDQKGEAVSFLHSRESHPIGLTEILSQIDGLSLCSEERIEKGFELNRKAAATGLESSGNTPELTVMKAFSSSVINQARMAVSAATGYRMSGQNVPIMACGGSGNHGITFFLGMWYGWELLGLNGSDRSLYEASAVGISILHQIKQYTGVLTPMCGCAISSGLAIAASLVWGSGGSSEQMLQAMNIVLQSLAGVICDGAKPGCAFKTSVSTQVSLEAASMALEGVSIPSEEGIAARSFEELLEILRVLHIQGMSRFDSAMVDIISHKAER